VLVAAIWSLGRLWPRLSAGVQTVLWWCAAAKFLLAIVWVTPIELRILPVPAVADRAIAAVTRAAGPEHPVLWLPASTFAKATVDKLAGRLRPFDFRPFDTLRGVPSGVEGRLKAEATNADGFTRPDGPALQETLTRPATASMSAIGWRPVLLGAWILGVTLTMVTGLRRWRMTADLVRRADPAPHETALLALDVARALGLRRAPAVRVSREVATPLVAGAFQPTVVLPAVGFARLSVAEQRMALCHELAHVKRADLWLGCVPALAERLFFFHPLVRLAAREYALCREAACDVAVITTLQTSPQDYGRLLLALGVIPGRTAAAAGASWSFSTLKRRLTMLAKPSTHSPGTRAVAAAAVAAAVLAIVPLRLSARPEPAPVAAAAGALRESAQTTRAVAADEGKDFLNYVLFVDGDTTQSSGTSADVRIARQYRRNGERLLWFRHAGGERVIRDPGVIDQVLTIWQPVNELGEEMGRLGERQGRLGAEQGKIGERQGRIGEEQAALGAKQGALGARQGVLAARQMVAFTDAGQRAVDAEYRKIDDEFRALDREMKALDARMRDLETPMADLNGQMQLLNGEMGVLHRKMDEASKKAQSEMADLIDRAVSMGVAIPVR
jgi:beta-lactamase regulating signal transducer with metallopeptidase domain